MNGVVKFVIIIEKFLIFSWCKIKLYNSLEIKGIKIGLINVWKWEILIIVYVYMVYE